MSGTARVYSAVYPVYSSATDSAASSDGQALLQLGLA